MKKLSSYLALVLGVIFTFQACASENLVGEYTGTFNNVEGYKSNVGDPCVVMVGTSDMYGGSMTFEIGSVEKLSMTTREVKAALENKSDTVKLSSAGGSGNKPLEIVVMKLGGGATMQSLTLKLIWKQQHIEKSATCGGLVKK